MITTSTSLFDYIKGKTFEEISNELSISPYSIKVKEKDKLYLLKYSQIESDFNYLICRQCRGIILEKNTNNVVCYGFDKFGNYGEGYVPDIDINNSIISEKIDGSLLKIYNYNDKWEVATNSTIDAHYAFVTDLKIDTEYSFYDLFLEILKLKNISFEKLCSYFDEDYTYCFELTHPISKIVIDYEPNLYLIGMRNNKTLKEINIYNKNNEYNKEILDYIDIPKTYNFSKLEDIIKIIDELPDDEEGYVVMDKCTFERMKVKSPKYLAKHKLSMNKDFSKRRIIECIINNVDDDIIASFPEYKEKIENIKNVIKEYIITLKNEMDSLFDKKYENRKEFAIKATKTKYPSLAFCIYDGKVKINDIENFIMKMTSKKIEKILFGDQ